MADLLMDKQEQQALWDELLVKCWRADIAMSHMLKMFLMDTNRSLLMDASRDFTDFKDVSDFISSLELRRCRDRDEYGDLVFNSFRGPVRAFVAMRCELMNNCLWNKDNTAEHIIENISAFKWVRRGPASVRKTTNRRKKEKRDKESVKTLSMRALDQKGQWDKVK